MARKQQSTVLGQPNYNPDNLLDTVIAELNLKNDAALARKLRVAPTHISKLRHRRLAVNALFMLSVHDVDQHRFPVNRIRDLMGVPGYALAD